jgi:HNH endonuclease
MPLVGSKVRSNEIPWLGDACIVCLESDQLSLEHVIPNALHGGLTCRFLCSACNSRFGSKIDAKAKSDPAIRTAARALEKSVPRMVADIEEGQRYLIHTDVAMLHGLKRGDEFRGTWHKMPDGSSIAPEKNAIESLRGRMRSEGLGGDAIEAAIARYMAAEPGEIVDMSPTWAAKKLAAYLAGPDLQAPNADPLLFVKIAYEFMALLVGRSIYDRNPHLDELRDVLKNLRRDSDAFQVEVLSANDDAPFHGIAFEGNLPHATFQIRLFGKSAYRVHLKRIAVEHKLITYTHDLESGEQWHSLGNAER